VPWHQPQGPDDDSGALSALSPLPDPGGCDEAGATWLPPSAPPSPPPAAPAVGALVDMHELLAMRSRVRRPPPRPAPAAARVTGATGAAAGAAAAGAWVASPPAASSPPPPPQSLLPVADGTADALRMAAARIAEFATGLLQAGGAPDAARAEAAATVALHPVRPPSPAVEAAYAALAEHAQRVLETRLVGDAAGAGERRRRREHAEVDGEMDAAVVAAARRELVRLGRPEDWV
jgi:hypothetical protein